MKRLILAIVTCSLFIVPTDILFAQAPPKEWDARFGGSDFENLYSLQQTTDGGYILGGKSNSGVSGDKTQASQGGWDYWVVKINNNGIKQWDARFGGSNDDELTSLQQTTDGGYILGGQSYSGISGDKTQASQGGGDYWVVKITSSGVKQWDARFGGNNTEYLQSLQQTTDGGYILGGQSISGISGDKTQASQGSADYWVVKINGSGVKEWDARFGGNSFDGVHSLRQTTDGGYLLGGYSTSGISGDKTQASWGGYDYWVVKINNSGVKQWDARFGGISDDFLNYLQQTTDGGYILGGDSYSGISGDKTQASQGLADYWIVKINSSGVMQWDARFGGSNEDDMYSLQQTIDGGYILGGYSNSAISGDKTQASQGGNDQWVVKINSSGVKQWDARFGGSSDDYLLSLQQTTDGGYILGGQSTSGISGDKTQASWGLTDYWVVKLAGLTTGTIASSLCAGAAVGVPYTANGTYNAGNIFTAQLSDAAGTFAAPVNIGTQANTTSGTITATLPGNTLAGSGYRIRVVSDNPVATGNDNGSNITINALPTPTINGTLSFCSGSSTTLDLGAGYSSYSWSTGATTQTINVNTAGSWSGTVTLNGCSGTSPSVTTTVTPNPSATISGSGNICLGNPVIVQLNFSGTGSWNYTISDGSQIVNGSSSTSSASVNITPTTTGTHNYTITVLSDANCSGTSSGSATVTVSNAPPLNSVGALTGPAEACNGTVSLISVNTVGGQNIHYSWNTGTNSSVVMFSTNIGGPFTAGPFQTTTNSVYAQFGVLSGSSGYNVCVQGVNGCGSTNNKCNWIRGVVGVPGTIIPANGAVACPNEVKNYSCGASGGATVYNWTLSGSATPITNGQGTQNIQVTFPSVFTSGQLCVTASLSCGGSSTSAPRCMTISNIPAVPGAFTSGPSKVCPGATGIAFTVPAVPGATGYNWTTPVGTTITGGANTPSITVNFPGSYTGAPPVCVSATSACGSSVARCKTVGSNIPGQPGAVTGPTTNICNSTVQYSISNVSGASGYTWTNPAGTTITSGQGSTTIQLVASSSFNTGSLTVVANTSLCSPGSSPPRTISITGKPNTPGTISAFPGSWCNGGFVNFSITPVTPLPAFNWTVSNGTITAGQSSNNIDVTWGTGTGTVNVTAGNSCGGSGTRSQSFTGTVCREEGINEKEYFSVYPNPAHDKITLSIDVKESMHFNIVLTDISGREILSEGHECEEGLNTYDMDLKKFAKGIYMLEMKSADKNWKSKVVIE